jgi:hypothetical protein
MDSSPNKLNAQPNLPSMAGVKRPAPSLLPAFEPLSSSPGFPRPSKRRAQDSPSEREAAFQKYPTPVPTSTTGILSSSPPNIHARPARPGIHRTQSSLSERAPLSALPTVSLPENGESLLMGRSSNSSHYQLSANRLISRVHVKARYIPATVPLEPNKVEIICAGWNGIKLHCQGRTWELAKGDSFTSETEYAEIMLDVQDARVLIAWPDRDRVIAKSESSWDDENSPRGRASAVNALGQVIESSPLRRAQRIESPESPTPAGPSNRQISLSNLFSDDVEPVVKVYEDEHTSENEQEIAQGASMISTEAASSFAARTIESQSSELSEPEEEQDPDEENDPIVHSFGPFGANISSRMASFTTGSPEIPRGRTAREPTPSPATRSSSEATNQAETSAIVNHVINQLAFSRLSSTPLSVILNQLPESLKNASPTHNENRGLTKGELQKFLNATACIGEIHREGKDAAGKALDSEYYYIPDEDTDENRRAAVVDGLRKPSLRGCRKQHKVNMTCLPPTGPS